MSTGPVEQKVKAGAGVAAVGGLIVWLLKEYAFGGADVPEPVVAFVFVAVPAAASLVGGYLAKHTFRNDPDARNAQERPPTA